MSGYCHSGMTQDEYETAQFMRASSLTVGEIPNRKGVWLGVECGSSWEPLAKFRNEEAADEFMRLAAIGIQAVT